MNPVEQHQDVDVDISALWKALKRAKFKIVLLALIVAVATLFLAASIAPRYQAETRILIELQESAFTRLENAQGNSIGILDAESIQSQVEILRSTDLLKQAADVLKLGELTEFNDAKPSMSDQLLITFGLRQPQTAIEIDDRVIRTMRKSLKVYRIENSRVIVVEFQSKDPVLSAKVPDTIADIFLEEQRSIKVASESTATDWLAPEIKSLRERVKAAEARVAQFRSTSDLLPSGNSQATLNTQQLSELSSELSRLRANRASGQATIDAVEASLNSGGSISALPAILSSSAVQRLRDRELQVRSQLADLSTTLLDGHPRIIALKAQLRDVEDQIRDAAAKELLSLRTQVRTAELREQQVQDELNTLKIRTANAGEQEVELRALEREAAAESQLLESYLTRFNAASSRQQGSYVPADARIFSRAIVPTEPYAPKIIPMVAGATVGSILLSIVMVLMSELFSGRAMRRTPLAVAPAPQPAQPAAAPYAMPTPPIAQQDYDPAQQFAAASQQARQRANRGASLMNAKAALQSSQVQPQSNDHAASHAMPKPTSSKHSSVQVVANSVIATGNTRAIILSASDTADTAGAVMFARYLADENIMTIIVDLTLDAAVTLPMVDNAATDGLTNVLCGDVDVADAIVMDKYSSCHLIARGNANPAMALRNINRLPSLLETLERAYDLVIIAAGEADPEAITSLISHNTEIVMSALDENDPELDEKLKVLTEMGVHKAHIMRPVLPQSEPLVA